jgi:glycosyltransferase involved in cell wall biosynthesis
MPDAPRFSVIIPAYNASATLAETVASVRAQTYADWELVIVDDGSTDDTLALAESFAAADARIRVVTQANRGSGGAYNTGVREARADLLVMLSADDLLLSGHFAAMDTLIEAHPDAAAFTCNGFYEYPDGTRETADPQVAWADPAHCTLEELLHACWYGVGAVFRRPVFDTVGGFREDIYAEDYLFWLLALARGFGHRHTVEPLSVHRRNDEQKSARALAMREADAFAIREVLASGLLDASARAAAETSLARIGRTLRTRRLMYRLIGSSATERIIARVRGRRI